MKIVILDGFSVNPSDLSWKSIENLGNVTIYEKTPNEEAIILKRIGDAEIVLLNKIKITKNILDKAKNLKYIGVLATGFDNVDLATAKEKNIVVTNIPSYSTDSVAQHTFALLLSFFSKVGYHSNLVKENEWHRRNYFTFWDFPLEELAGKTIGIIGMGSIGKKVYDISKAFGMRALGVNSKNFVGEKEGYELNTMDYVLKNSDIISIHCPLNEYTRNLIRQENIEKMKDGVVIVNTSRGPVINEADVVKNLESKKIRAFLIDVSTKEPMEENHPLLGFDEVTVTPHIAWATVEARKRLIEIARGNIEAFINGNSINVVN